MADAPSPDSESTPTVPPTIEPVIVSPDAERLQAFYTELVGAVQVDRIPVQGPLFYVTLRLGGSRLGVVSRADVELGAPQRILLAITVPDVDVLLPRVEQLGGRLEGPPTDMPWGQRVAHIADPDGNAVNLSQTLPS